MFIAKHSLTLIIAALTVAATTPAAAQEDNSSTGPLKFSFVHTSDTHVPAFFNMPSTFDEVRSWPAVRTLKGLGSLYLRPYQFAALAPSFIINTGDITEFGFAGVTDDVVSKYFDDLGFPMFYVLGNHDNTWTPPLKWIQQKHGGYNYSFDFLGVHFIGLNTAGIQDPRPSIGQETITFLKKDLEKVARTTPIILFFHHPLTGTEFSSAYDYHRLTDVVEEHNVILALMGHGHSARMDTYDGIPTVMGGSTFSKEGNNDGYSIVSLDGHNIRVAYRRTSDPQANKGLYEAEIPERSYHPQIVTNVSQTGSGENRQLVLSAEVKQSPYALGNAQYSIDDEVTGTMKLSGSAATVTIPANKLESGVHFVRFSFDTNKSGVHYTRSMPFAVESGVPGKDPVAAWRYQMSGGSRTKPFLHQGRLYVGGLDGVVYALNASTGKPAWTLDSKSPVTAGFAAYKDLVIYGTGDGTLRGVTANGQVRWKFDAADSIMGHPVVSDGHIYFACNGAVVYCLDAATGERKWHFDQAQHNVETAPIVYGGKLYFGAWDGNIYCLDALTGKKEWHAPGPRNQTEQSLPTYYSPADAELVAIGQKLYSTDRAYHSASYTLTGQMEKKGPDKAVAFAPAADGKHLYLRRLGAPVCKVDTNLNIVWESEITGGSLPYAPVESNGVVYGISNVGQLYALDAASGKTLWTYSVSPKLYVHAAPTVENGMIYTVSQDGVVTAVKIPAAAAPAATQTAALPR